MTLFDQIEASANIDNIDDAVRAIRDLLGQEDGGPARAYFSDGLYDDKEWETMTPRMRKFHLGRYVIYELGLREFAL